ncbi:MAG: hypothetical protein CVT67_06875 [Actinobacteria bacterium HGW-Actinobacteria-7]|nr:MAG: hypothetical protein CVT67_06875 [Actinobacteria bacterium HGW-Actinobacteria-7]
MGMSQIDATEKMVVGRGERLRDLSQQSWSRFFLWLVVRFVGYGVAAVVVWLLVNVWVARH